MLEKIGRGAARHHWVVIVLWLAIVIGVGVGEAARHGEPVDEFSIPGTPSQQALDLLDAEFPAASGASATVVYQATNGKVTDPANQAAIEATITQLRTLPGVSTVSDPFAGEITGITFDQGNPVPVTQQIAISQDQTAAYSSIAFPSQLTNLPEATSVFQAIQRDVQPAVAAGLKVDIGGQVADIGNPPDPGLSQYSEPIGLVIAVVILLLALGSVTSMAVPIGIALMAVSLSHNIINILMASFTIGSVAPILGSMIGLGVGIDYSLFVISRFRQNLAEGMEVPDAAGNAIATSGSAVLFAGITVCIALSGLYLVGIPYVTNLGFVAALFVAVTVVAALTLLPALLGLMGHKVNSLRIHRHDETADIHKTLSARWAGATSKHPVRFALISLVVLVAIAAPVKSMELGFTDDGDLPAELTQRQAYDVLSSKFGPGVSGPLIVAVDLPPVSENDASGMLQAFSSLSSALQKTPGVARVSLPLPNRFTLTPPPTAAIIQITPSTAPNSEQTADLVQNLRSNVIPNALQGTALPASQVYVGGQTALLIDLTDAIKGRLAAFIGGVILGAFVLLMMVFRSLFVPFKAAVMNLLSIGGAYGIIVVVFQWGWAKDVIGLTTTVPVVAFVPVMMFAVLFGLSMDYEVFLLSRIREEYHRTGESRESVVTGLAATARVITSAALIMIAVFLAFVPNPDPTVKMIGLGMAMAVFIDATIVRMMLVPSTMELAGKANWWLPAWLDKILPRINVE